MVQDARNLAGNALRHANVSTMKMTQSGPATQTIDAHGVTRIVAIDLMNVKDPAAPPPLKARPMAPRQAAPPTAPTAPSAPTAPANAASRPTNDQMLDAFRKLRLNRQQRLDEELVVDAILRASGPGSLLDAILNHPEVPGPKPDPSFE